MHALFMAAYAISARPAPFTATTTLKARAPFDFARTLGFLGCFPPTAGEQQLAPSGLGKVLSVSGRAIACTVMATARRTELAVTLRADAPIDEATCDATIARLRFHLSLDDDLAPFYALASRDPAFSKVARAQHGHHHVKFPSPFEIACWAVLGQRTPMGVARKVKDAIVARFGPVVSLDAHDARAFPEAPVLADEQARLAEVVRDPRKASSIVAIARAFADVDERFLREGPFGEVESWLQALPRIGPWSSAFILFRGLGRMPRLSLREGPIFDAGRRVYGATTSDRAITEIADGYGEWCGYWALYLRARSR
jgi:DNA-3-methyladenine glycosylase II